MTSLRRSTPGDHVDIVQLLESSSLPVVDYDSQKIFALVAEEDGKIVGHVGVEIYDDVALLRSLAVDIEKRERGLARQLVGAILEDLPPAVCQIVLLTETAEGFFRKLGFSELERSMVPQSIAQTREFTELCPASAMLMTRML